MKKKRILLGLALAATAVFSLSACNGEEKPEDPAPADVDGGGDGEVDTRSVVMNGTTYESIKKAFAAIPASSTDTFTIVLGKGTYNENALVYNGSATIKIKGDTTTKYGADVIIKGHGSDMTKEKQRELIEIQGSASIILENLTLESDWSRAEHSGDVQAEVLGTDTTGTTAAYNCSFKSHQDTLRTTGKAWFYGCYIEGDTDFIWMEEAGQVALYEKCEIVSVYDANAKTHNSYLTAPRMAVSARVGKGLVIYNSTVKESEEAKANNQLTYLGRTPWSSGVYNQVAYINTQISDIETSKAGTDKKSEYAPWYGQQIATEYDKTIIGWKMDQASASSFNYAGNGEIIDAEVVSKEYNGRKAILNRIYHTGKGKYEKDVVNNWDIDAVITANGWTVEADASSDTLAGEVVGTVTTYTFDGKDDKISTITTDFTQDGTKAHFVGNKDAKITVPVTGKCYVEVFGYYSGTMTAKADTQNQAVMFFNSGNTKAELINTYTVFDANATEVVLESKAKTYITKIVVTTDDTITETKVTDIEVSASSTNSIVGVALALSAKATPSIATNRSVLWSSSDETIATIDPLSGVVTFLAAGTVTFTATACDGSGVTETITRTPIEAKWNKIEWYTKDDNVAAEAEATGIEYFTTNDSTYKNLDSTYTFTDLSGDSITTSKGLKLNSAGKLTVATTKTATLTLVSAKVGTYDVAAPSVKNGSDAATLISTKTEGDLTTYVYRLEKLGTWDIERSTGNENSPLLYASIVNDATWDFQNANPTSITSVNVQGSGEHTGEVASDYEGVSFNVIAVDGKLQYNSAGYAQMNAGTVIRIPVVNVGSVVKVVSYDGQSNYTIGTGDGAVPVDLNTNEDEYVVTAADKTTGYVEIVAAGTGYIYSIKLTNPR